MAHPTGPFRSNKHRLRGTLPTDPRYEITFEESAFGRGPASRLLRKLAVLTARVGEAIGDGYARAVGVALDGVERLEDSSAERRLRQRRSPPGNHAGASAVVTPDPTPPLQK
jgi:hypothetical protein